MTSFGKKNIHDRFPHGRDRHRRLGYLPIYPATHPDIPLQLRLDRCPPLRLKSYVNIRNQRTIPLAILQPYDGSGMRYALASASYREVIGQADFELPTSSILSVDTDSNAITGNGSTPSMTASLRAGRRTPKASKSRPCQSPTYPAASVSSQRPVPGTAPISAGTQRLSSNRSLPATQGSSHHFSTHPHQASTYVTVLVASQAPVPPSTPAASRTKLLPANRSHLHTQGSAAAQPDLPVAYGTFSAASTVPATPVTSRASVNIARLQPGAENRPLLATQGPIQSSTQITPRIATSGQPDTLPLYYSNRLDNEGGDHDARRAGLVMGKVLLVVYIVYKVWIAWSALAERDDISWVL